MGRRLLASLISAVLLLWAVPAWAGTVEVHQLSTYLLEVSGGNGPHAWHIRYATRFRPAVFATLEDRGNVAWFSHYNWLRRIDTEKGIVTGRWMLPGLIKKLQFRNGRLQATVSSGNSYFNQGIIEVIDFDPEHPPEVQAFNSEWSQAETLVKFRADGKVDPAEAGKALTEQQNTYERDRFSPWFGVALAAIYDALDIAGGVKLLDAATSLNTAHYSESLDMAAVLVWSHLDFSRRAFDRGYAGIWQHDQDPRLTTTPIIETRLQRNTPELVQRELMDRVYKLNPWIFGAENAWRLYGNFLINAGNRDEGALWLARADEAHTNWLLERPDRREYEYLASSLLGTSFLAGAVLYGAVLFIRYRPQRKARLEAERAAGVSRPGCLNVEYWRKTERIAFFSMIAVAWFADGYANACLQLNASRSIGFFSQMQAGALLGPSSIAMLENDVPQSPERELFLAMALQRNNQPREAERHYRAVPQFAEAWNNLGVLLKNAGDDAGSRAAFMRALAIRPDFPEAEWNLGGPPRGEWVKFHAQFVPEKPMPAVPTRTQLSKVYGIQEGGPSLAATAKGPLGFQPDDDMDFVYRGRTAKGLLIFGVCGGLVLLCLRPREVFSPPPRYQAILDLLIPGTARVWNVFGGLLLGATCMASSKIWPVRWARMYSFYSYSGDYRRFPLPWSMIFSNNVRAFESPIPSFRWFAGLFMLNVAVVLFWKWKTK